MVHVDLWLLVVLLFLGTYRVTRLITYDQFPLIAVPRERVTNWWDPTPEWREAHPTAVPHWGGFGRALGYLWECDWCVSVYVGAGLTWLTYAYTDVMQWVLMGLAASAVTGIMRSRDPE